MSILDPDYHKRILDDIEDVCANAGITPEVLHVSSKGFLSAQVLDWVRGFRNNPKKSVYGLCLVGDFKVDPTIQCMHIAGGLVRNFIDARVRTLTQVLEDAEGETECLIIPDFYEPAFAGGSGHSLTQYQIRSLHSMLLSRLVSGRQTVVHISGHNELEKGYGKAIRVHLDNHFAVTGSAA